MTNPTPQDREMAEELLSLAELCPCDHCAQSAADLFKKARLQGRREALEEAARVAELWLEPVMATSHENATYRAIATAIRKLSEA